VDREAGDVTVLQLDLADVDAGARAKAVGRERVEDPARRLRPAGGASEGGQSTVARALNQMPVEALQSLPDDLPVALELRAPREKEEPTMEATQMQTAWSMKGAGLRVLQLPARVHPQLLGLSYISRRQL
jgi:hypothetical protein